MSTEEEFFGVCGTPESLQEHLRTYVKDLRERKKATIESSIPIIYSRQLPKRAFYEGRLVSLVKPYDVPPGRVRAMWWNKYVALSAEGRLDKLPYIIFFDDQYMLVHRTKVTPIIPIEGDVDVSEEEQQALVPPPFLGDYELLTLAPAAARVDAPAVGTRIFVFWDAHNVEFAGVVAENEGSLSRIEYDDGDEHWHRLSSLRYRLADDQQQPKQATVSESSSAEGSRRDSARLAGNDRAKVNDSSRQERSRPDSARLEDNDSSTKEKQVELCLGKVEQQEDRGNRDSRDALDQAFSLTVIVEGRKYRRPNSPPSENPDGTMSRPRGRNVKGRVGDNTLGAWAEQSRALEASLNLEAVSLSALGERKKRATLRDSSSEEGSRRDCAQLAGNDRATVSDASRQERSRPDSARLADNHRSTMGKQAEMCLVKVDQQEEQEDRENRDNRGALDQASSIMLTVIFEGRKYRRPDSPPSENPDGTLGKPRGRDVKGRVWDNTLGAWAVLPYFTDKGGIGKRKDGPKTELGKLLDFLPSQQPKRSRIEKDSSYRDAQEGSGQNQSTAVGTTKPWVGYSLPDHYPRKEADGTFVRPSYASRSGVVGVGVGVGSSSSRGGHELDMPYMSVPRTVGTPMNDDDGAGSSTVDKGRRSYMCGWCGAPKKGHVCPYNSKLKR